MPAREQRWHSRRVRTTRRLRVLIADDDRISLDAVTSAASSRGYEIVGAAQDGRVAVLLAGRLRPDVAVLNASMPVMGGLDAARHILKATHRTAVVLLSERDDDRVVHEALRIGVRGLLLRAQGLGDLLQAISDVSDGAIHISALHSPSLRNAFAGNRGHGPSRLTTREQQMLRLICDGKTMKEAAVALAISVRTAQCHRAHIMGKLRIHHTAGLVRYAIREGVVVA